MVIPFWQIPWPQAGFGVRTAEDPATMIRSIAAAVHAVDPAVALAEAEDHGSDREREHGRRAVHPGFVYQLRGGGAVSCRLGIYGVMAFSVAQRSHEIALRMALGASRNRVVALVVGDGIILAAIGLGLGLIGAYFVGRAMQEPALRSAGPRFLGLRGCRSRPAGCRCNRLLYPRQASRLSEPHASASHRVAEQLWRFCGSRDRLRKKSIRGQEGKKHPAGAKQAAEKGSSASKSAANHPSGAKALLILCHLAARLKSCPFKTAPDGSFSASCKAHVLCLRLAAGLKSRPYAFVA